MILQVILHARIQHLEAVAAARHVGDAILTLLAEDFFHGFERIVHRYQLLDATFVEQ